MPEPGEGEMKAVTFQVLEGIDKGRVFRDLPIPVTIGREEGNVLRLNDERVSRYHAKIQQDNDDVILTDLESTNGTRVNGNLVQIRRLRLGDCICVGRSLLLFGSNEEIAARIAEIFDFLHRGLSFATESMRSNEDGNEVQLSFNDWQKILAVQMLLARYLRAVSEPECLEE